MGYIPGGMAGKEKKPSPLSLNEVKKRFKKGLRERKDALKGVSLKVKEGEIFGLLGPNGAGKSTLVKISLGLSKPSSGQAMLNGLAPEEPRARMGVGYLPEHFRPPPMVTPKAFMNFMGKMGSPGAYTPQEVLTMVGLEPSAWGREMGRLSKGMLQRVGLASAFVHRPRFLVLDEPLSGLDPMGRHDVKELMLNFNAEGGTIFLNSHILADIGTLCHRVGILHQGNLLYVGTIENLYAKTGKYGLEEAFMQVIEEAGDG